MHSGKEQFNKKKNLSKLKILRERERERERVSERESVSEREKGLWNIRYMIKKIFVVKTDDMMLGL